MRVLFVVAALVLGACSSKVAPTPAPPSDLVLPNTVPNGRVEIVIKPSYANGKDVTVTVRLIPSTGTLRGPMGLLGSDVLSRYGKIAIDYDKGLLVLDPPVK